jgi:hypothetical protein
MTDMLVQVRHQKLLARFLPSHFGRERRVLIGFQVMQGDSPEVRDDDPSGYFFVSPGVLEAAYVVHRLRVRLPEVLASALVLNDQAARPEQVDGAPRPTKLLYGFLERRNGSTFDAENVEELIPERLALRVLTRFVFPVIGKHDGAMTDLVPTERHSLRLATGGRESALDCHKRGV